MDNNAVEEDWGAPVNDVAAPVQPEAAQSVEEPANPENVTDQPNTEDKKPENTEKVTDQSEDGPKDNDPAGDDDGSDDSDFFKDLDLSEHLDDNNSDPAPANETVQGMAKDLGIEASSPEEFVAAVKDKLEELQGQVPQYANDDVKNYIENVHALAQAGEDFRGILDGERRIKELKTDVENKSQDIKTMNQLQQNSTIEQKTEFLELFYTSSLGMSKNEASQVLSGLSESEVILKFHESAKSFLSQTEAQISSNQTKMGELESITKTTVEQANENKRAFQKSINSAIDNYSDPDGKSMTAAVQVQARKLFNTDPVNVSIPKGIAEKLFLGSDGKFDANKSIQSLAQVVLGPVKYNHLKTKAKVDGFRDDSNYNATPNRVDPTVVKNNGKEDWTGEVKEPTRKRGEDHYTNRKKNNQ